MSTTYYFTDGTGRKEFPADSASINGGVLTITTDGKSSTYDASGFVDTNIPSDTPSRPSGKYTPTPTPTAPPTPPEPEGIPWWEIPVAWTGEGLLGLGGQYEARRPKTSGSSTWGRLSPWMPTASLAPLHQYPTTAQGRRWYNPQAAAELEDVNRGWQEDPLAGLKAGIRDAVWGSGILKTSEHLDAYKANPPVPLLRDRPGHLPGNKHWRRIALRGPGAIQNTLANIPGINKLPQPTPLNMRPRGNPEKPSFLRTRSALASPGTWARSMSGAAKGALTLPSLFAAPAYNKHVALSPGLEKAQLDVKRYQQLVNEGDNRGDGFEDDLRRAKDEVRFYENRTRGGMWNAMLGVPVNNLLASIPGHSRSGQYKSIDPASVGYGSTWTQQLAAYPTQALGGLFAGGLNQGEAALNRGKVSDEEMLARLWEEAKRDKDHDRMRGLLNLYNKGTVLEGRQEELKRLRGQ